MEKSAIFVIMPEENPNTFFMISLIIQQFYREILAVADEQGGKLKNRCIFFCDEFGTLPKIQDAEMIFSASRSRRLQIVPIIQSFSQLDKNYGAHDLRRVCAEQYVCGNAVQSPWQPYGIVGFGEQGQERSVGKFADDRAAADDGRRTQIYAQRQICRDEDGCAPDAGEAETLP